MYSGCDFSSEVDFYARLETSFLGYNLVFYAVKPCVLISSIGGCRNYVYLDQSSEFVRRLRT